MWLAFLGQEGQQAPSLYVGDLQTQTYTRVLKFEAPAEGKTLEITSLGWSPDGSKLAFGQYDGENSALMLLELTSGELKKLVDSDTKQIFEAITWSPGDTPWINYVTKGTIMHSLWLVNPERPSPTQLYPSNRYGYDFHWSEDGSLFYYQEAGWRFYSVIPGKKWKTETRHIDFDFELNLETGIEKISGYSWEWYFPEYDAFMVGSDINFETGWLNYERYFLLPRDRSPGRLIFEGPHDKGFWFDVEISPDARWAFFGGDDGGYIASLERTDQKELFKDSGWFQGWGPDGASLAIARPSSRRGLKISTYDLDSGQVSAELTVPPSLSAKPRSMITSSDDLGIGLFWDASGKALQLAGEPVDLPSPTPTRTPGGPELDIKDEFLTDVKIIYTDPFNWFNRARWDTSSGSVKDGVFEMTGEGWFTSMPSIQAGDGMLIKFKILDHDNRTHMYLEAGDWDTDSFCAFGIFAQEYPSLFNFDGREYLGYDELSGNLRVASDTWYNLMLVVGKDKTFLLVVWDPEDDSLLSTYRSQIPQKCIGRTYKFVDILSTGQTVSFDDYSLFKFGEIK